MKTIKKVARTVLDFSISSLPLLILGFKAFSLKKPVCHEHSAFSHRWVSHPCITRPGSRLGSRHIKIKKFGSSIYCRRHAEKEDL